jgi:hypothetical protein
VSAMPASVAAVRRANHVGISVSDLDRSIGDSLADASWGGASALMLMHLKVAACGLAGYRVLLPLDQPTPHAAPLR